jgi:hypothetical protein
MLAEMEIPRVQVDRGGLMGIAYETNAAFKVLSSLPLATIDKYHIDQEGEKWASTTGLAKLFSSHYPDITAEFIDRALMKNRDQQPEWLPARVVKLNPGLGGKQYKTVKLYKISPASLNRVNAAIKEQQK